MITMIQVQRNDTALIGQASMIYIPLALLDCGWAVGPRWSTVGGPAVVLQLDHNSARELEILPFTSRPKLRTKGRSLNYILLSENVTLWLARLPASKELGFFNIFKSRKMRRVGITLLHFHRIKKYL